MKKILYIFTIFLCVFLNAQQKEFWLNDVQNGKRILAKDSVSAVKFLDSLSQNNYYLIQLKDVKKEGSHTEIFFDKGKNFNEAQVKISDDIEKNTKQNKEFFTKN